MIPVGPHGDFGSDHPDGKGTFARRKMARPCTGKPITAFVSTLYSKVFRQTYLINNYGF